MDLIDFLICALVALESNKLRSRTTGLNNLSSLLGNTQVQNLLTPPNTTALLKSLRILIHNELETYVQEGGGVGSSNACTQRLQEAADHVKRIVIKTAASQKTSQFEDIIKSITRTLILRLSEEKICIPLAESYSRTLVAILEIPQHLQYIKPTQLYSLLEFMSTVIELTLEDKTRGDGENPQYNDPSVSFSGIAQRFPQYLTELLQAISLALEAPIVFPSEVLSDTWRSIHSYFVSSKEERRGHDHAVRAANLIFYHSSINEGSLCDRVAAIVYHALPTLWNTRSMILREQILVFIQISFNRMTGLMKTFDDAEEDIQDSIYDALLQLDNILTNEQSFLSTQLFLKMSDIHIKNDGSKTFSWFNRKTFQLNSNGNIIAWMSTMSYYYVRFLYIILTCSDYHKRLKRPRSSTPESQDSKSFSNKYISEYISSDLSSLIKGTKEGIKKIQFFLIHSSESSIDETCAKTIFDSLYVAIYSDDIEFSAWALLGINNLLQLFPKNLFDPASLDDIWRFVNQRIYTQEFGAAGCQFLYLTMTDKIDHPSAHKSRLEKIISIFDSNGPKVSYSSIDLVYQILNESSKVAIDKVSTRERLISWALGQIINTSLINTERYQKIDSQSMASVYLAICGIDNSINSNPKSTSKYFGTIPWYNELFHYHILVDNYLKKAYTKYWKYSETDELPMYTLSTKLSLPVDEINSHVLKIKYMINELLAQVERLDDPIKLMSDPNILQYITETLTSIFLICSILQKTYPEVKTTCLECLKLVQSLFQKIKDICNIRHFQDQHRECLLLGIESFLSIRNHINNDSSIFRCYQQIIKLLNKTARNIFIANEDFGQQTEDSVEILSLPEPREVHSVAINSTSLRIHSFEILALLQITSKLESINEKPSLKIVADVMGEATSEEEFLFMANTLKFYVFSQLYEYPSFDEFESFLKFFCESLLKTVSWARSESVLVFLLEYLQHHADLWVSKPKEQISSVLDVVAWILQLFEKNIATQSLTSTYISFLFSIIKLDRDFTFEDEPIIFQFGSFLNKSLLLKFYFSSHLKEIFDIYPTESHLKLYCEVFTLDYMTSSLESFVLRIQFLTKMACGSKTTLVPVLYNIVELGGIYEIAKPFSTYALLEISSYYNLKNCSELLSKFAVPLLYLWIDSNNEILQFPFDIFGYESEIDFLTSFLPIILVLVAKLSPDAKNQLELITKHAGTDLTSAIETNLYYTYSSKFIERDSSNEVQDDELDLIHQSLFSKPQYSSICAKIWVDIVENVFSLIDTTQVAGFVATIEHKCMIKEIYSEITPDDYHIYILFNIPLIKIDPIIEQLSNDTNINIRKKLEEPHVLSYTVRSILDKVHESLDPIETALCFRRLIIFLNWVSCDIDYHTFSVLITGIFPLLRVDIVTSEASEVLKYFLLQNMDILAHRYNEFFIPTAIDICQIYFEMKETSKSQVKLNFSWLKQVIEFLKGESKDLILILLDWLNNEQPENFPEDKLFNFLHSDEVSVSTKNSLLYILSIQLNKNDDFQNSLFQGLDIKPILNVLLEFSKSLKSSIDGHGFATWVSRLIAEQCSSEGTKMMTSSLRISHRGIKSNGRDGSLQALFSSINDILCKRNFQHASEAEVCLRVIYAKLPPDLKVLLKKSLNFDFSKAIEYSPSWYKYTLPHPKPYAMVFESCSLWAQRLEIIMLKKIETFGLLLSSLGPLLMTHPSFSLDIFPYIIHLYLLALNESTNPELNLEIQSVLQDEKSSFESVEMICNTFLYLRNLGLTIDTAGHKYLEIDLVIMASALLRVKSYENAYMIMEIIWSSCQIKNTEMTSEGVETMFSIFQQISSLDMYYSSKIPVSISETLKMINHERDYGKLLQFDSALLSNNMEDDIFAYSDHSVAMNLSKYGFDGISQSLSETINQPELYNCNWRLGKWDLPEVSEPNEKYQVMFNLFKHHNDTYLDCKSSFIDAYYSALSLLSNTKDKEEALKSLVIIKECEEIYFSNNETEIDFIREKHKTQSEWIKSAKYVIFFFLFFFLLLENVLTI